MLPCTAHVDSRSSAYRIRSENVGTELVARDTSAAFLVEATSERAIEARAGAQGLPQVADRCPGPLGVSGLLLRGQGGEIRTEAVHARILPFGNSLSIPFGKLPFGNGDSRPMTDRASIVAARRKRLTEWIKTRYGGKQAAYIADTGLNQGMVSDLQKTKSFGEEVAANIEAKSPGMPAGYLVNPMDEAGREPASVDELKNRLRMTEDMADALSTVLAVTLRVAASQDLALGRELAASLGKLQGSSGSQKQVIEGAVSAVAEGLESWELAGPRAAPGVSGDTRSRKGR